MSMLRLDMARVRQINLSSLNPSTYHVAMHKEALHVWVNRGRPTLKISNEYGETSLSTCRWHPYLPAPLPTFFSRMDVSQSETNFVSAGSLKRVSYWGMNLTSSCWSKTLTRTTAWPSIERRFASVSTWTSNPCQSHDNNHFFIPNKNLRSTRTGTHCIDRESCFAKRFNYLVTHLHIVKLAPNQFSKFAFDIYV